MPATGLLWPQDSHKVEEKILLYNHKTGHATKKQHASKMCVTEMRMLRWMCHKTMGDRIRKENLRGMEGSTDSR